MKKENRPSKTQFLCGLGFVIISVIVVLFAMHESTLEEQDISPIFLGIIGAALMFKKIPEFDEEEEEDEEWN